MRQTFTDWELLAVDDCSTDGSFERLQWWERQDNRIRSLKTPENGWLCATRNYGLKQREEKSFAIWTTMTSSIPTIWHL